MSLKVFKTTRFIRRVQHHLGGVKPLTVKTLKRLSRRRERRLRRDLRVPADTE